MSDENDEKERKSENKENEENKEPEMISKGYDAAAKLRPRGKFP